MNKIDKLEYQNKLLEQELRLLIGAVSACNLDLSAISDKPYHVPKRKDLHYISLKAEMLCNKITERKQTHRRCPCNYPDMCPEENRIQKEMSESPTYKRDNLYSSNES